MRLINICKLILRTHGPSQNITISIGRSVGPTPPELLKSSEYLDYAQGYNLTNRMPLFAKVAKKLHVNDTMNLMRTHFEGSWFDNTGTTRPDVGAGPGSSPYKPVWPAGCLRSGEGTLMMAKIVGNLLVLGFSYSRDFVRAFMRIRSDHSFGARGPERPARGPQGSIQ